MQKVDKEKAEKVLRMANEKPVYQDDTIGASIDSILRGSHKTYRYVGAVQIFGVCMRQG